MIPVTLLGTSCMVPTKERNTTSFYVEYNGEGILFDCGEGTQRQMNIAGINRNKVKRVYISHWHGDHVTGLIGLIQTVNNGDEKTMYIYGPKGTKERFNHMLKTVYFDNKIEFIITEVDSDIPVQVTQTAEFEVNAINLDHGIPAVGYVFVEKDKRKINTSKIKKLGIPQGPLLGKLQQGKTITFENKKYKADELTTISRGKRIAIVMDTVFTKNAITIAQDADLLICESTYLHKDADRGEKYKHLTVQQAAQIAHSSNVKKLILTHFSQRYNETGVKELEEEARDVFPESYAGYDFMKLKV